LNFPGKITSWSLLHTDRTYNLANRWRLKFGPHLQIVNVAKREYFSFILPTHNGTPVTYEMHGEGALALVYVIVDAARQLPRDRMLRTITKFDVRRGGKL